MIAVSKSANTNVAQDVRAVFSGRLRSLDIFLAIRLAIEAHNNEISDLNTEQLNRGQKADGSTTGDYANIGYKGRLRPVDLCDTGDFHESIHTEAFEKAFDMVATDEKTDMLKDKYGDEIVGLTGQNIDASADIIKESVIENVRGQL